jgi:hypothetical protein
MEYIVIGIVVAIVVFFVCRELNCWYFKINERVSQLDEIKKSLDVIKDYIATNKKSEL